MKKAEKFEHIINIVGSLIILILCYVILYCPQPSSYAKSIVPILSFIAGYIFARDLNYFVRIGKQ